MLQPALDDGLVGPMLPGDSSQDGQAPSEVPSVDAQRDMHLVQWPASVGSVGAEHPRVPTQLGWHNARSLDEALEMAQGFLKYAETKLVQA